MGKVKDTLLGLTLLALVLTGPAAVAAYLLSGQGAEVPLILAAAGTGATASETPKPGSRPSAAPLLTGVLYTRGTAQVDWNGEKIPVSDGSYAYLGGEVVSTGPGDMGVLRLDENDRVYMCPGSRMSVSREQ